VIERGEGEEAGRQYRDEGISAGRARERREHALPFLTAEESVREVENRAPPQTSMAAWRNGSAPPFRLSVASRSSTAAAANCCDDRRAIAQLNRSTRFQAFSVWCIGYRRQFISYQISLILN
jgi:hypothetical protein